MGRKRLVSGPHEVANAERLFRASEERGQRDFRFVAMAIGAEPYRPPNWAIWECIAEKDRAGRRAASGLDEVGEILDEVARYFARDHFRRDDEPGYRMARHPSLQKAIRVACATLEKRTKDVNGPKRAETTWMKDIERAWKREQQEDVVDSYYRLLDWKITRRIDDVIEGLLAEEYGYKTDLQRHLWMARQPGPQTK